MSEEAIADVQPLTNLQIKEKALIEEVGEPEKPNSEQSTEEAALTKQETVSDSETETEESAPEEEIEQEGEPKKSKGGFQKRIDKLTKKASELERQLEAERAEKERILSEKQSEKAPKESVKDDKAPNPEDFETYAEYNRAMIRHEAKVIRQEEKRQEAEQRMEAELAASGKKFQEKLKEVAKLHDDFDEVFDPDLTVNGAMQAVMLDSDVGAELAYYLCKNPEEAAEIASMNPVQSARKMALIEARLSKSTEEKPTAQKTSKAPAPVNSLKGTAGGKNGAIPENIDDFKVWYQKTYGRR